MKKIIFLLVFLFGCSNLEFVYNTESDSKSLLKGSTTISVLGDNSEEAKIYLYNLLNTKNLNSKYNLSVKITKNIDKLVIESSSTVSKYTISHTILYELVNVNLNCQIFVSQESSSRNYDSKSGGYNFGTDRAEKEAGKRNLHTNINKFFLKLDRENSTLVCPNEN